MCEGVPFSTRRSSVTGISKLLLLPNEGRDIHFLPAGSGKMSFSKMSTKIITEITGLLKIVSTIFGVCCQVSW
jgi:hypothetical protein